LKRSKVFKCLSGDLKVREKRTCDSISENSPKIETATG